MVLMISIIVLLGGGALTVLLMAMKGGSKHRQILIDLGLEVGVGGKVQTQFYKWGWRKQSAERVWAEVIVKEAFRKARIWVSAEDLAYFERACTMYAKGKTPSDEKLKNRVRSITDRMDALRSTIANHVRDVMQRILNTSAKDAKVILDGKGIHVEDHQIMSRFGTYYIRHKLSALGKDILGYDAKGCPIGNDKGETVVKLKGMTAWKVLLDIYIDEVQKQTGKQTKGMKATTFLSIERQVNEGLLRDYLDDVTLNQKFVDMLDAEIQEKDINGTIEEIEKLESIFYGWRFTEGIPVNNVDHKRIRKLLCNKELAGRFREIVIDCITPDFKQSKTLLETFPKSVIFHGASKDARAFASEIYQVHYRRLLEAFAPCFGVDQEEPVLLIISEKDFNRVMEEESEKVSGMEKFSKVQGIKQSETYEPDKVVKLLDRHKKLLNRERNLTDDLSEKKGWIVNIPVSNDYPEAFALFDAPPYSKYIRFNCDSAGPIDFMNRTYQARKQREIFFNLILDMLTNRADLSGNGNGNSNRPTNTPVNTAVPQAVAV